MKTNLLIILTVIGIFSLFSSCDKTSNTPSSTFVLSRDSSYYAGNSNNQQVRIFDYNSSKKLVRVLYKYGMNVSFNNLDTIYYNASGKVSKIESYYMGLPSSASSILNPSTLNSTTLMSVSTCNYTSDVLTSINESGTNGNSPYVRTRTLTYSSGKLLTQTVTYTTGTGQGDPENITGIVYTGNNVTSANVTGMGAVTLTWDLTAPNPYYGLFYKTDDFINMFNKNNILQAYLTAEPTVKLTDNTYTYANDRVATINSVENTLTRTTILTYKEL